MKKNFTVRMFLLFSDSVVLFYFITKLNLQLLTCTSESIRYGNSNMPYRNAFLVPYCIKITFFGDIHITHNHLDCYYHLSNAGKYFATLVFQESAC